MPDKGAEGNTGFRNVDVDSPVMDVGLSSKAISITC